MPPRPKPAPGPHGARAAAHRIILFNKPCDVLCQFRSDGGRRSLADFVRVPDVYPAGRLDADSEGLVVLTSDGVLQAKIADPKHKLQKTYWVQVEGVPTPDAVERLGRGVVLADGMTRPATVRGIPEPVGLWARDPPIRIRKSIPTAWLEIGLLEGRNRQIRRMTAAVGYPTLRLVRVAVGPWTVEGLSPGEWREARRGEHVLSSAPAHRRPATVARHSPPATSSMRRR